MREIFVVFRPTVIHYLKHSISPPVYTVDYSNSIVSLLIFEWVSGTAVWRRFYTYLDDFSMYIICMSIDCACACACMYIYLR